MTNLLSILMGDYVETAGTLSNRRLVQKTEPSFQNKYSTDEILGTLMSDLKRLQKMFTELNSFFHLPIYDYLKQKGPSLVSHPDGWMWKYNLYERLRDAFDCCRCFIITVYEVRVSCLTLEPRLGLDKVIWMTASWPCCSFPLFTALL